MVLFRLVWHILYFLDKLFKNYLQKGNLECIDCVVGAGPGCVISMAWMAPRQAKGDSTSKLHAYFSVGPKVSAWVHWIKVKFLKQPISINYIQPCLDLGCQWVKPASLTRTDRTPFKLNSWIADGSSLGLFNSAWLRAWLELKIENASFMLTFYMSSSPKKNKNKNWLINGKMLS